MHNALMRYVVLEHVQTHGTHFDLMLEVKGQELLRTIQLERWPLPPGESCRAIEIAAHRAAYLTYEGEVSGGRGHVRRIEAGTWSGNLTLRPDTGPAQTLRFEDGRMFA